MILDYLSHDFQSLLEKLYVAFFTWFVVIFAVIIDLYHGIQKSKSLGEYTHSYGLRQTIQKIVNYLSMMLFMLLFDCLNPLSQLLQMFKGLPIASVLGALILVWIEFISVREKADQKFRRKTAKATKELLEIITKDEGVLQKVKESFKSDQNESTN